MKKQLIILSLLCCLTSSFLFAQESKENRKAVKKSNELTFQANKAYTDNNKIQAEATYRKAIATNQKNTIARYNLGNTLYEDQKYYEAFAKYKQAAEIAEGKTQKHKAYHNMGNVFMQNKEYDKAVEAYKEALRNNPEDDETRYNLALAKEFLKKQQQEQQQNNDQDQNNNDNKDQKDKKDGEGENNNQNQQGDNKEDKENENNNKEDKGDQENKDQQQNNNQNNQQDKKEENKQQQPRKSQLSPQQIKALLKAMSNEEKKVQEKLNAKKVKGAKVKTEKDW